MKELFIQYKGILKDLLRYGVLKTEALEHTGLYNGKLGMTILFYEYSRYSGDALYEQFADEILESIMELPDDLSLDLSDGLCGIGWGITYLLRERFITGEIKDVLSDIDIKIQETEILNDDTLKDYHTYLMFRKEYIGEDAQRDLPYSPLRYTSGPDALGKDGIWGGAGINSANVAMSATETITTNARVLGADPLVKDGFGEEDMLTLVLPYIKTAREGVLRLGELLETYGTYESNGIAFADTEEIWWLETIGGHHWIAKRVPDDTYVTNPNQLGIDHYEFENSDDYLASPDIRDFINKHHLDLTYSNEHFNPRYAFGSQRDKDRHYNTPRAWAVQKFLNTEKDYDPKSFFIPWCQKPYRKITVEDVKYVLSLHYQDTPYDPYGPQGDAMSLRQFRPIGINRTSQTVLLQMCHNKI